MMLTVNLLRAARSCPVKSTLRIVLSRRTSPHPVLSKNPIDAVRRADSTLDARRVATFVTAESLC